MDQRSRACLSVPFDVVPRIYRSSNVAVTVRVRVMQEHKGILTAGDLAHSILRGNTCGSST